MGRPFSKSDQDFIKKNYGIMTPQEIADVLERTLQSIYVYASRKKLSNKQNHKDLTGQRFGRLTAIKQLPRKKDVVFGSPRELIRYLCLCDCGNIIERDAKTLVRPIKNTSHREKSCGCSNVRNLINQRFGKLTVVKFVGSNKHGQSLWLCLCDCGGEAIVTSGNLVKKFQPTVSCGCNKLKYLREAKDIYLAKVLKNNNLTQHTNIVSKWDYEKNELGPENYSAAMAKKVWWKCPKHGSYESLINNQVNRLGKCPKCSSSIGELKIMEYLDNHNIDYVYNKKTGLSQLGRIQIDFFLPSHDIYIEFNGKQHYALLSVGMWGIKSEAHAKKRFKKQQNRDEHVRSHLGNKLLEIPYWDINNIETLLKEKLQND